MYRRMLVPLSGARRAERVLRHVEELAHRLKTEVVLLRVLPAADHLGERSEGAEVERGRGQVEEGSAAQYLAGWVGEFREKGIEARWCLAHGAVAPAIVRVAGREKVDLIALTSRGNAGLTRVFSASVAAGVLQGVDCPLFVVRCG